MYTLYVGNQADANERTQILVTELDARAIAGALQKHKAFSLRMLDYRTKQYVTVADEDCGYPYCRCALRFVGKPEPAQTQQVLLDNHTAWRWAAAHHWHLLAGLLFIAGLVTVILAVLP